LDWENDPSVKFVERGRRDHDQVDDPALREYDDENDPSVKFNPRGDQQPDLASKDGHFEDPAADMSENELQAGTGQVCPVCHRVIEAGEPRRRRIDGTYQHDAC
jgi:hypothetical protein